MTKLSKIDIQKIEEYWKGHEANKQKLKSLEQDSLATVDEMLYSNLKNITQSIDLLFPTLDEDLQTIVNMRYWDINNNCYEWEEIADTLFISRYKAMRKRDVLIDKTASLIGWI